MRTCRIKQGRTVRLMDAEKAEEEFPLLGIAERTFEDEPGTAQKHHTQGIVSNPFSCPTQPFPCVPPWPVLSSLAFHIPCDIMSQPRHKALHFDSLWT